MRSGGWIELNLLNVCILYRVGGCGCVKRKASPRSSLVGYIEFDRIGRVGSKPSQLHQKQLFDRIPLLTDVAQRLAFLDARGVQSHVLVPLPWLETVPEVHRDKERCVVHIYVFPYIYIYIYSHEYGAFCFVSLQPASHHPGPPTTHHQPIHHNPPRHSALVLSSVLPPITPTPQNPHNTTTIFKTAPSRPAAAPTPRPPRWSKPTPAGLSVWLCCPRGIWRTARCVRVYVHITHIFDFTFTSSGVACAPVARPAQNPPTHKPAQKHFTAGDHGRLQPRRARVRPRWGGALRGAACRAPR